MGVLVVQNINNENEYKFASFEEILMITMTKGRIPTFHMKEGQYLLLTKFEQYRDMVKKMGFNFAKSDRGILINIDRIEEYDDKRRVIFLDKEQNVFATVSESRRNELLSILEKKNSLD